MRSFWQPNKTSRAARPAVLASPTSLPPIPWRQLPLVLLLLILAIVAITWPWKQHISAEFLQHWDPPFHAWKLELVARSILSGHWMPPDGNTNMYYPYSGTMYFEALHWPQALVAAPLLFLGANPISVYHLVMIFFWALAGVCLWMLLLALGATRRAALLGALLFTIMPYRVSYMVEFNMQLCFGLPLFFFFLTRYFQRPSLRYACGLALAWWLQAVSELYQAIFLLLILPFPGLALISAHWRWLRDFRRFWLPALAAIAIAGGLSWLSLRPYLTLLDIHTVNRNLQEIATHVLEPLSFLRPGGRFHILPPLDARQDEMIVYPTLAMILLTCAFFGRDIRRLARVRVPPWITALRIIRWSALVGFALLTFGIYFGSMAAGTRPTYAILPVIATIASALLLLVPADKKTAHLLMTGLFAGAIFAFFMSFGPGIRIRHARFSVPNHLYLWIYDHLFALQGFRVVSRFSIFVMLFMTLASALAWSQIERRWLNRRALRWLWVLPLLVAIPECLPRPFKMAPIAYPLHSPVLDQLDARESPYVIAMAPMGIRELDSRYMLQIARTDRLFVYAWGGAYPAYTTAVRNAMDVRDTHPAEAAALLRQLWPECFILEDKQITRPAPNPRNFTATFQNETTIQAEDDRFVLLRLLPPPAPDVEHIRLVRRDHVTANPILTFQACTPTNRLTATLWLDINGHPAHSWNITPAPQTFRIQIPPGAGIPILPTRFRFRATADTPFHLEHFALAPQAPTHPDILAADWLPACLPWINHFHQRPPGLAAMDIHYPDGFALLACEPLETQAPPGGALRLRHYFRCPPDMKIAANRSICVRLRATSGRWIEASIAVDATADMNDILCQPRPTIYAIEQTIPIPADLPPDEYSIQLLLRTDRLRRLTGRQNNHTARVFTTPHTASIQP